MSNRWYRAYAGTVKDDKLAEASVIAGCSRSIAIAVWHSILESAAETEDGGRFETTPRRVAAALAEPMEAIKSVFDAMAEIGMIEGGAVSAWRRRQYEGDTSTERSRRLRERRRNVAVTDCNGDATGCNVAGTLQGRCATPPDTEADTETEEDAHASSAGAGDTEASPEPSQPPEPASEPPHPAAQLATKITSLFRRLSNDPNRLTLDTHPVHLWAAQGFDMRLCEAVVLGKLEQRLLAGKSVRSLNYFEEDIREAHQKRAPEIPKSAPVAVRDPATVKPAEWERAVRRFGDTGDWPEAVLGPPPGHPKCTAPGELTFRFQKQGSAA
ncbi:hypothetical protein [Roseixanthobacter glucoisosaccharinicivorans]|uniref:hypothetical protein n=1 Tax=Roseixanthobacter glucoisosaccharinicivorans TaxID=3119923 RepID=UPI0037280C64